MEVEIVENKSDSVIFSICSSFVRFLISTSGSVFSVTISESLTIRVSEILASITARNISLTPLITASLIVVSIE